MTQDAKKRALVLVVGAGASKEAGLPIGKELTTTIARALDIRYEDGYSRSTGDARIDEAFRVLAQTAGTIDISSYLHCSWRIRDAMPLAISIDNFIDSHRDDASIATCGKLAIARCILDAEANGLLAAHGHEHPSIIRLEAVADTWFASFFKVLTENCSKADLADRLADVAIICFNYDRCIEHFLHVSLQHFYSISGSDATNVMAHLKVYHPYGSVGPLPWQSGQNSVRFGHEPTGLQLTRIAQGIRTFTEGTDEESSDIIAIRATLKNAERVCFLGFAFHALNQRLLFDSNNVAQRDAPIFGTALGLSAPDVDIVRDELANGGGYAPNQIHLRNDRTCFQLFEEYRRALGFR